MRWRPGAARWLRAVDPRVTDVVLAAVVTALSLAQLLAPAGPAAVDLLGVVITVLLCAPLAVRSRAPRLALVAMTVVTTGYVVLGYPQVVLGLPLVVAVYTVGARHGLRASSGVLALLAVLLGVSFAADRRDPGLVDLVVTVATLGAAWWAGATVRGRREQVELVEERSALLERVRRDEAGRAVARERLRIARELHDVVAHSMSVVAVQSGMAQHVLATQPERAG